MTKTQTPDAKLLTMKHLSLILFLTISFALANPNSLIYQGKYKEAYYEAIASSHSDSFLTAAKAANLYAEFTLSDTKEKEKFFQFAVEHAGSAIALDKDNYRAYYQKAYAQAQLIRYAGVFSKINLASSIKHQLDRSLAINPEHADSLAALALWNLQLSQRGLGWIYGASQDKVIPLFEQAVTLEPKSISICKDYGFALIKLKDFSAAKKQLERCLELPAHSAKDEFGLARAQALLDSLE